MKGRRFLLYWLALLPSFLPSPVRGEEVSVSLTSLGKGVSSVEGSFEAPASSRTAWGVISDYSGLPRFVSSMKSSEIRGGGDGFILLEQKFSASFFFFKHSAQVLLKVREEPLRRIEFEDVSKKDFELYKGSWEVSEAPAGVRLSYRLAVKENFHVPGFAVRQTSKKMVRSLLEQVRSEIIRRSGPPAGKARLERAAGGKGG